ncbi:MAG: hypothetical protein V4668_00925 [Patescibacteria group bacterium]
MIYNSLQRGYVALLSVIIIGAMLLTMTIGVGQSGWYTRFMVLGAEAKQESKTLAANCMNEAIAHIMVDPLWRGSATTSYGSGVCYVYPIQIHYPQTQQITIRTKAEVRGAITNLVSEYNMQSIHLDTIPLDVSVLPLPSAVIIPTQQSLIEIEAMP